MIAGEPRSFRISLEALDMLESLIHWTGLKRSGVIDQAIREKYQRESGWRESQGKETGRESGGAGIK